jgi:ComF family protein
MKYPWVDKMKLVGKINLLAASLLPPRCVLCGSHGEAVGVDLCAGCRGDFALNNAACVVCAQPLPGNTVSALRCGRCLQKRPRFDASICPYRYSYPLDHLLRALKYRRQQVYGRVLGDLLANSIASGDQPRPQLLLPVPLASKRFAARGFNQAIEIGLRLERALAIPLAPDRLTRTRETAEQASLDQKARRKNVKGAFAVVRPLFAKHVAIIDDVVTTGSTVNELARVLRKAGARRIEVWAVARAGQ